MRPIFIHKETNKQNRILFHDDDNDDGNVYPTNTDNIYLKLFEYGTGIYI